MLEFIRNLLWGPSTVAFIAILGIALSIKTDFRALKHPVKKLKNTLFSSCKNKSSMEAMFTALGGTIGVGNTIGVAGAIKEGGAGAVLWMIVASVFGMVIKEAEIFLAVKYKNSSFDFSGPMFYIRDALGSKLISKIWCISCILTAFGMGNFSQSMSAVNAVYSTTGVNRYLVSVFVASIVCFTLLFGLQGIKKIVSSFVPVLTVVFIASSSIILITQIQNIPEALENIFKQAFNLHTAGTGIKWSLFAAALREGFSRGIFTNEAGLGSSSIVHSSSTETTPEKQGAWGVVEVFIDTVVICTLTALMILSGKVDIENTPAENITLFVFSASLGKTGAGIYTVATLFFAIASVLAWYYYAECAMEYLKFNKSVKTFIKCLFVFASFLGGIISAKSLLYVSDIFNAIMLLINMLTMFLIIGKTKSN